VAHYITPTWEGLTLGDGTLRCADDNGVTRYELKFGRGTYLNRPSVRLERPLEDGWNLFANGLAYDSSHGTSWVLQPTASDDGKSALILGQVAGNVLAYVGPTTPFTWAAGDQLLLIIGPAYKALPVE
jgi:hypothetical protein